MLWQPYVVGVPGARIEPGTGSKGAYPAGDTLDVRRTGRLPRSTVEEEHEEMDAAGSDDTDQAKTELIATSTRPSGLVRRTAGVESDSQPNGRTKTTIWRKDTLLKWVARLIWCTAQPHFVLFKDTEYTARAPGGAPPCLKLVFFIGLVF